MEALRLPSDMDSVSLNTALQVWHTRTSLTYVSGTPVVWVHTSSFAKHFSKIFLTDRFLWGKSWKWVDPFGGSSWGEKWGGLALGWRQFSDTVDPWTAGPRVHGLLAVWYCKCICLMIFLVTFFVSSWLYYKNTVIIHITYTVCVDQLLMLLGRLLVHNRLLVDKL